MSFCVVIDPVADRDIDSAAAHIAEHSLDAAHRFLQAAMDDLELLSEIPDHA